MFFRRSLEALCAFAFVLAIGVHHADAASTSALTFTPAQIPNLAAWFDPSQTNGVGGGAGVSYLKDWSGNNNALYQEDRRQAAGLYGQRHK